jgi:hypothetical protein
MQFIDEAISCIGHRDNSEGRAVKAFKSMLESDIENDIPSLVMNLLLTAQMMIDVGTNFAGAQRLSKIAIQYVTRFDESLSRSEMSNS